jgi:hypothetical protein
MLEHNIEEADLSLTAEENFKRRFNKFKEFFSRKNILKFGIMIGEDKIPIESICGNWEFRYIRLKSRKELKPFLIKKKVKLVIFIYQPFKF